MITLLSAFCVMLGVFWLLGGSMPPPTTWARRWLSRQPVATEAGDTAAGDTAAPKKAKAWVTEQSLTLLGWSPEGLRVLSLATAGLIGIGWGVAMDSPIAGALMAIVGWQLPAFYAELRGAGALTTRGHQIATFIEIFADAVEIGRPAGSAVEAAALAVNGPPLEGEAQALIRRINGGASLTEALAIMGEAIRLPLWDLFVDLVRLNQFTINRSDVFRDLDWQLQEQDRVQVEFRTLIMAYMAILTIFFAIMLGAGPLEAIMEPHLWQFVTHRLSFIPLIVTMIAILVFSGLRKYGRMRIAL
jgi:hypothetical protein